jgi:LmbE family N-acetylglucosaminyl deacetylase
VSPQRVVAVYAHPDDADVSCGGTLARWAEEGAQVTVVVCTSGDKGSIDPDADPRAIANARADEVAKAVAVLGASAELLGHPDGELENDAALRRQIVELVRRHRPEVVVCPDPTAVFFGDSYFNHRDHRVVGWATLDAVTHEAAGPHYFPDTGAAHRVNEVWLSGSLEPDHWVDIGATVDVKAEALACHETQLGGAGEWLRSVVRQRAEEAGRQAGVTYAEGFRRLVLVPPSDDSGSSA